MKAKPPTTVFSNKLLDVYLRKEVEIEKYCEWPNVRSRNKSSKHSGTALDNHT
jgi:hypothetical protein